MQAVTVPRISPVISRWCKPELLKKLPRGRKPALYFLRLTARLKSCPFKTRLSPRAVMGWDPFVLVTHWIEGFWLSMVKISREELV